MNFFLTFGQKNPLKNHYMPVLAKTFEEARQKVIDVFGPHWSMLYKEKEFDPAHFPAGPLPYLE